MRLVVIGLGQCGCSIADQFCAINNCSRSILNRRLTILADAFAVNTSEVDLKRLEYLPKGKHHRMLPGELRTFGHGVGKVNTTATKIIQKNHSTVIKNILKW